MLLGVGGAFVDRGTPSHNNAWTCTESISGNEPTYSRQNSEGEQLSVEGDQYHEGLSQHKIETTLRTSDIPGNEMSSAVTQAYPQQTQTTPTSSFPVTSSPASQRQYQQHQSSLVRDPSTIQPQSHSASSPPSTKRPSRRPSDGNSSIRAPNAPPNTPQHPQYQSPNGRNVPSARGQPPSLSTHSSPPIPNTVVSVSTSSRRESRAQNEGPPIPPPPRTSSNQRGPNTSNPQGLEATEASNSSRIAIRLAEDRPASSRVANSSDGRNREQGYGGDYTTGSERERAQDDTTTAAAAAARSRRKVAPSPETPKRSGSTKQSRTQQSPSPGDRRQAAVAGANSTSGPGLPREGSTVINRVVITDPQIDIEREQERVAESQTSPRGADVTPVTGLGLVGSEGVDDGGRGGSKARQDYSASAARRKETRFGEYVLGQTLGEGEFGKVKLGWKKDGSVQVAIKLIRRETLGSNPSRLPKIYREISILRELSHPNIVRLHEMVETDRHIGIILEYASGGELFDYILNHRYLKDNAARRLFAQLVSGVGYLHKKGIVHRDLKLENLLLDRNRNIIITDFGFANTFDASDELGDEIEYNLSNRDFVKKMDLDRVRENGFRRGDLMQTSCGSPCYAAPELVVSESLYTGRKVDVWSCGVILVSLYPSA